MPAGIVTSSKSVQRHKQLYSLMERHRTLMEKPINLFEFDANLDKDHLLVYYKGPFLETVLAAIGTRINETIPENTPLNKKVFFIFLELAQNVAYYSEERDHIEIKEKSYGRGTFVISEWDSHYTLSSANLIKKSWGPVITEKCAKINKLDTDALRKWKRELRNQPMREGQLGANIGLIDIVLKAGSPLQVAILPIDEVHSNVVLSINVSKNIN